MKIGIYAGTFDPVTKGHLSILQKAAKVFDLVIIAIAADNNKKNLFSLEERQRLVEESIGQMENVIVESFSGLLVDYAAKKNAAALVRGLRAVSDFEYEMQMAMFNKDLAQGLETIFFIADAEYSFISSSQVKNIASLHGKVDKYVSPAVEEALKEKYQYKQVK